MTDINCMKNIIAVVKTNGGIWLNSFEILSFNKVSIVSFLSLFKLSSVVVAAAVVVIFRDIKVPFVGVVGVEQSDGDVKVKTCKSFNKILSKAAWLKREE